MVCTNFLKCMHMLEIQTFPPSQEYMSRLTTHIKLTVNFNLIFVYSKNHWFGFLLEVFHRNYGEKTTQNIFFPLHIRIYGCKICILTLSLSDFWQLSDDTVFKSTYKSGIWRLKPICEAGFSNFYVGAFSYFLKIFCFYFIRN